MANEYLKCDGCGKEWNAEYLHSVPDGMTACCFCGYNPRHGEPKWCPERMVREIARRIKGEPHLCDSCVRTGSLLEKA